MVDKIVSVTLNQFGELEVVRRIPSSAMYACNPPIPVPDRIVKELYRAAEGGMIRLVETIEGKCTPAYVMVEKIEF